MATMLTIAIDLLNCKLQKNQDDQQKLMETAVFQILLFTCLEPTVRSFNINIRMKYAQCKHAGIKYFLQFSTITYFVNNP